MNKMFLIFMLFSSVTVCMKPKNKLTTKKINKKLSEEGFIPRDLLEQWRRKHNEAMFWVKSEREKKTDQSNQQKLVFYVKTKKEGNENGNK